MSASPLIPGHLYLVNYEGEVTVVCAAHPVDAMLLIFNLFNPEN